MKPAIILDVHNTKTPFDNTALFETLEQCRTELKQTNSKNDKIDILARYPSLAKILNYTHDKINKIYGITTKLLDKEPELCATTYIDATTSFYEVLDKLYKRQVTGYNAVAMLNYFISCNKPYEELIRLVLDRNLKCGIDTSSINKALPNTIPTFDVALAKKFEDAMLTKTGKNKWHWSDWIVMRKLDGIRCICIIDDESNARFFSRAGNEFHTLQKIADEIKKNGIKDMVLDGELCIVDDFDNEDFSAIAKEFNKKDHTILRPKYIVFDQLTQAEFENGTSERTYLQRLSDLIFDTTGTISLETIDEIDFSKGIDFDYFIELKEEACQKGWEGLILRKNVPYEGKRTKNILKVKQFHEAEYKVHDYGIGEFRVISKVTGLEETITTMTNVLIYHKGNVVSVGSGFSIDERKFYFENPQEIIGKEITVKYFEESTNSKDDSISLRFPTLKRIWKDGRNV